MGKNPEILKKCEYLGNVVLSLSDRPDWKKYKRGIDPWSGVPSKHTYSFYTNKETNHLVIKRSIRYYRTDKVDREIIDVDTFINFWFDSAGWGSSGSRDDRLNNLAAKVPKLRPHLALFML